MAGKHGQGTRTLDSAESCEPGEPGELMFSCNLIQSSLVPPPTYGAYYQHLKDAVIRKTGGVQSHHSRCNRRSMKGVYTTAFVAGLVRSMTPLQILKQRSIWPATFGTTGVRGRGQHNFCYAAYPSNSGLPGVVL
jgi:hypothetical protein